MFGAKTPFGASSTFGTGTTFGGQTSSPFGQTPATGTGGSLFGSTSTQPAFGSFGTSQQPSTGLFGSSTNTGTTGLFGSGTTTGSLFGQPTTSSGSIFGANAASSGGNLFGGQSNSFGSGSTGFGTSAGKLFGAPSTSASTGLFGSGTTGTQKSSLFGGTSGFQSTGFGATQGTTQAGTPVKFNVVNGTDQMVKNGISTTVNTRHQCITVMKEYDSKSFEELRFEDYTLGRKTGPSTSGGLFSGTTATTTSSSTGGLFGSNTSSFSPFSQAKTGFGTTGASTLFGQANQQQSGGLFGSKPAGLFGTNTATTSTSGFGSTFGSTQSSGGLFGQASNTSQTGGLFGATSTTQSGGLFGSTNTGFGQATTGTGLFGQAGFGNTQQQQTGLFNNKIGTGSTFGSSTSGGLFGSQNKPATSGFGGLGAGTGFGSTTNSSLFNKPAFGTPNTGFGIGTGGTGLFGTGATTGLNTGGNVLGTGLGTQTGFGTAFAPTGTSLNLGANTLLGSQNNSLGLAQQQQQQLLLNQQILALNNSPFGDSKLFRNSLTEKTSKALTNTTASSQHVLGSPSHYKVSSKLTAKIKPRPINYHTMNKSKLFEGLDDDTSLSPDTFVPRKSVKKLIIKNKTGEEQDVITPKSEIRAQEQHLARSPIVNGSDMANTTSPMGVRFSTGTRRTNPITSEVTSRIPEHKFAENVEEPSDEDNVNESVRLEPCGIILTRPEYYVVPSINELNDMIDSNGEVWVTDFVVGREGYGEVKFLGRTNVADLNLDDIVFFRRREIEVYPESFPNKPPVGERLNKKAEITLLNVWPNDKATHTPIKTPERLRLQGWLEKVEAATAKLDATFLDYRPETGTWVFIVEHFTKYGIHEFLEAENVTKKPKKVMIDVDNRLEKEKHHKEVLIDDEEKMFISKSIHEHHAKITAFEQEKESAATESMQDQDSDIDDLELETFPDEMVDDEEQFGELPASHQLAAVLGVSAHRMQVMKASFFGESQHAQPVSKPLVSDKRKLSQYSASHEHDHEVVLFGSPRKDIIGKPALLPYTVASDSPSSRLMDPSAIGSALDRGTKLVGARAQQRQLVPKEKSITNNKEHFIGDLGLVMGRSFRVGWGPGFTFVHSGNPKGQKTDKTSTIVMSSVTQDVLLPKSRHVQEAEAGLTPFGLFKERINIASYLTQDNEKALLQHVMGLEVELDHSKSTVQNGCPLFEPSPGTECIHHHAEMCKKNIDTFISGPLKDTAKHMSLVWDLVVALWGQQEEKHDHDSYSNHMSRRKALCSWFANACEEKVKAEVDHYGDFEESDYLKAIWSHLTGGQISQACNLAKKHNDYRLAVLLAQATGHISSRQLVQQQLHDWELLKADNYISDQRLKIIALLAGALVWRTSTDTLNTCHELDWKRTFAVHMLYQSSPSSSIAEILSNYEDSYQGMSSYGSYGAPPIPPYMENNQDFSESVQDTCYHLIKLYCERSHSLEKALAPSTYTPFQLDYRQSWYLSLAMVSLGYTHMSSYHAGLLHTSFAAQLEALGLWQWSAFVLLHLEDCAKRESAVRSLLYRHCELSTTAEYIRKEEFLQEKLHIPPEWINEAKAIRAMYLGLPDKEAVHLLKSQQWNHCHEVVLNNLASGAIINEEYDDLHSILSELEPKERCSTIKNWSTGGQVILDFLKVDKKIKGLTEGSFEPTKYNFEELHMHLSSLCNRISNLPSTTAQDRLCQYELAQKCANYLKLVTLELGDLSEDMWFPSRDVVPHISQLPLPEDYRLAELRDLTTHYVLEI